MARQSTSGHGRGWDTNPERFDLTEDDIEHGQSRNQWACAVVRAIQRRYGDALRVRVNAKLIGYTRDDVRYTFPTPPEVVEQVIKPFDRGEPVEPQTIRLNGGKKEPCKFGDDAANARKRDYKRNQQAEVSERKAQMSPTFKEYERF